MLQKMARVSQRNLPFGAINNEIKKAYITLLMHSHLLRLTISKKKNTRDVIFIFSFFFSTEKWLEIGSWLRVVRKHDCPEDHLFIICEPYWIANSDISSKVFFFLIKFLSSQNYDLNKYVSYSTHQWNSYRTPQNSNLFFFTPKRFSFFGARNYKNILNIQRPTAFLLCV